MQEHAGNVMGGLAAIGAAIGLGQLLLSDEPLTKRRVVGRALVSGGLGCAAAGALVWTPLPPIALAGLAAALSSLGTAGLERLFRKHLRTPGV